MAGAMRSPARRVGNERTHAHDRMEAHEALPALARVRRSGTRNAGQPGTVARSGHRRAVTVSDRPAGRPVPPLARASARHARTRATGRTTGRTPSVPDGTARPAPWPRGGEATTANPRKKPKTGEKVIIPTPQEWAEEQLKNAPPRSEEWAKKVARIYCLDIGDDDEEEKAG